MYSNEDRESGYGRFVTVLVVVPVHVAAVASVCVPVTVNVTVFVPLDARVSVRAYVVVTAVVNVFEVIAMGYYIVQGACLACGKIFSFNPYRVPSSSALTGRREPICLPCFIRINATRVEKGLPPFPDPLPGAYDYADESELGDDE